MVLSGCRVLVFGSGGLCAWCVPATCRSGIICGKRCAVVGTGNATRKEPLEQEAGQGNEIERCRALLRNEDNEESPHETSKVNQTVPELLRNGVLVSRSDFP
jgi:hypothetical protein